MLRAACGGGTSSRDVRSSLLRAEIADLREPRLRSQRSAERATVAEGRRRGLMAWSHVVSWTHPSFRALSTRLSPLTSAHWRWLGLLARARGSEPSTASSACLPHLCVHTPYGRVATWTCALCFLLLLSPGCVLSAGEQETSGWWAVEHTP